MNLIAYKIKQDRNLGYFRWIYIAFAVFSCIHFTYAQSNIKAGYVATRYSYGLLNDAIDRFNATLSDEYSDRLGNMNLAHGVEFGYRFKFDDTAIDLSYSLTFAGTSTQIGSVDSTQFRMRNRHHTIHGGVENYFGNLGIGAAAQLNFLRLSGRRGTGSYALLDNPNYFSVKLYLAYELPGNSQNSVSIQPYIDLPIASDHSLDGVTEYLGVGSQGPGKIPLSFGIRLLIYNGPQ